MTKKELISGKDFYLNDTIEVELNNGEKHIEDYFFSICIGYIYKIY